MDKRDLYHTLSTKKTKEIYKYYLNFLQYADGKNDLESISTLLNIKLGLAHKIYNVLKKKNLFL